MVNNYSNRGAVGAAVSFDPTQAVKNADGTYFQWYRDPTQIETLAHYKPFVFNQSTK